MKIFTSRLLAAGLALVFIAGLMNVRMQADDKKSKDKDKPGKSSPTPVSSGGQHGAGQTNSQSGRNPMSYPDRHQTGAQKSEDLARGHGIRETTRHDGTTQTTHYNNKGIREKDVAKGPDGSEQTRHFGEDGKTVTREVTKQKDGTEQTKRYAADGKTVTQEAVKKPNGTEQTKHYAEDGKTATREVARQKDGTEQTKHYAADGKTVTQEAVKKPDGTEQTKHYAADGRTVKQEVIKKQDGTAQTTHFSSIGVPQKAVTTKADGTQQTTHFSPSGRPAKEVVQSSDGTTHTKEYALNGKDVRREEIVKNDGTKEITTHHMGRDGTPRAQESVHLDSKGVAVSKTVIVNNTTIVNNKVTVVNNTRYYEHGHYGYVYRPVYVVGGLWYDPFWYGPTVVVHPFHYVWGWEAYPWYRHYYGPSFWVAYDVYPTPAYWVTDWMVAGYAADHYEATVSAAQAHEEARLAREDAEKAKEAAEKAADKAEIAEAKVAQAQAELRAKNAEDRAARAERMEASAGKPNPNVTPLDKDTKEELRSQIEQTIAEKKEVAKSAEKGQSVLPDLAKTLADPKHIYPVSKTTSVISAKDQSPAGTITEGDLLKIEPGQDLKNAKETDFVTMRVLTSKGEEGGVPAGTLISVPLRDVQEFDNEFRAKLDQGLAEADKKKDEFKKET